MTPIFFSNDKGNSWQRSFYDLSPQVTFRTYIRVSPPKIEFDKDGIVYASWINTYIKSFPTGTDSIINSIVWAYSDDKGKNWNFNQDYQIDINSNYRNPLITYQGEIYKLSNLNLIQNPSTGKVILSYTKIKYLSAEVNRLNFYELNQTSANFLFRDSILADSIYLMDNVSMDFDLENNLHLSFEGRRDTLGIFYTKFDFNAQKRTDLQFVSPALFIGSFTYPSLFFWDIIGLNGNYFSPTPKVKFTNEGIIIFWNATGTNIETLNHNLYYSCKKNNADSFEKAKIFSGTLGFQFSPDINYSDNKYFITWYDRSRADTSQTDLKLAISDDIEFNNFKMININSITSNHSTINNSQYNYGLGKNKDLLIYNNQIKNFWIDNRDNNLEIYFSNLTLDFDKLINIRNDLKLINYSLDNSTLNLILLSKLSFNANLVLYDLNGNTIFQNNISLYSGENLLNYNIQSISTGTYYLAIYNSEYSFSFKLIK